MNALCIAVRNIRSTTEALRRILNSHLLALFLIASLAGGVAYAGVTASISGTVTDSTGAAVAGATVTATNVGTGVAVTQQTNTQGFYSFQSLLVGTYTVEVEQKGFKVYKQTGVVVDVNSALVIDVALQVGQTNETVEVLSSALHVDTASTQMGEVIEGKEMTDVPLVTRSYTDLLALQPGVVAQSSGMNGALGGSFTSAGFSPPLVSGSLNAGALSVNGMREAANGFLLNGILVQETGFSGAGAIPNLDSIAEFRILTNNFDAEYGNYSGGQINVVTKSGTNDWHGNAFEFVRNTNFDAANYFAQGQRGSYHQNQFGGTFGGPIVHDKVFFFADYQGDRLVQAVTQVVPGAPSAATESGDLSGIAQSLTGTVNSSAGPDPWASVLSQQLGYTVQPGEAYYTPGCTTSDVTQANHCVLPNAQLSPSVFSPIATKLLPYILPSNGPISSATGTGSYSTSSQKINLDDNKFSGRLDANTDFGLLSGYYYFDRFNRTDPYWSSNAPLYPGFGVGSDGQTHNINLGDTKTFGSGSVNEFRLGYFRLDTKFNQPQGGTNTTLADLGFASGANGAPGIYVGTPSVQGVPEIDFNNFVIGVPSRPNQLVENIYQILDNYSRVVGTHTIKFGGQYHYNQLEENLSNVANGNFFFGSNFSGGQPSETGSDFVDFLLGAPSSYVQGQSYPSYGRNFYFGLYAQDSWRIKSNLTFNYGLRYDVSAPWHEKYNEIQTLIPGEQSVVFPGSPIGWVFPGDPGVPSSLAPTRWNNFAPRLGLAYSFGDHDGLLGKVVGKPGTTSIRAGWGMFYTSFEGATDFNEIGDAPFGNYTGQNQSAFAAPFTNRAAGSSIFNLFPVAPPPKNFSAKNPASGYPYDNLTDFYAAFGTIGSSPAFYNKNRLPYAENYELSIERQLSPNDLLTVSYVGTQGHRLLVSESANPGIPSLCLGLLAAGCGPGGENSIYTLNGVTTAGTRGPFSAPYRNTPVDGSYIVPFGNDSYFITGGYSSYNSAQINWKHTSRRSQFLVGYTFSKSLDNSSGYGEQVNPIDPRLSRGLSAFDCTHNFVASYAYTLPFDKLGGPKKLTNGWQISGITRFATGLPVTIIETDDRSLLGTGFGGPITLPVDTPNITGPVQYLNPRKTGAFLSASAFSPDVLGEEGDANRRFFHGPGINNWDFALLKNTQLTERFNLQFRAELFNMWNHAQFATPSGLLTYSCSPVTSTTNCTQTASSFGQVTATSQQPRIGQLSLKLNF
jgi:Carboxypeptidase regulatory-like domain/TonB dependent receptor